VIFVALWSDGDTIFWAAWGRPLEGRMDRPYGPVHSRGAEVAKHPTGVYLQVSWVQGEQASTFFFYRKKKVAKKNAHSV
jgi:hypothetical protein